MHSAIQEDAIWLLLLIHAATLYSEGKTLLAATMPTPPTAPMAPATSACLGPRGERKMAPERAPAVEGGGERRDWGGYHI